MRISLRYSIPIALILFTLALAMWSLKTNGRIAVDRVEKNMRSELTNILTQLQDNMEYELRVNHRERVQQAISNFGSNDHLKILFLIDEAGTVIGSTQFSKLGMDLENLLPEESRNRIKEIMGTVEEKYSSKVFSSLDNNILWGISPISLGVKQGDIRPSRFGFLIAQADLAGPRSLALSFVRNQVSQFAFFLIILVVGLGIFFHFQITRRVNKLVSATEAFARGDYEVPVSVKGRDEITDLEESLAKMARMRRWAENELRESEEENRSMIISAMDGIISFDEDGIVLSINPAAKKIFGCKVEDVLGKDIKILMPEVYEGEYADYFRASSYTDDKKITGPLQEVLGQRKDGSRFPLEISVSEVHREGQLVFVVIVRDISERKKSENELERYSYELKLSNEELEKFVYTASHDLQEPLRKVIIFGDRLKEACSGKLGDSEADCIHRMQKASFRMKDLITDLLEYSRLKFQDNKFEEVDLNILANEVIDDHETQILSSKGIVQFWNLPKVVGDKIQLRQLFQNLISNSLKYGRFDVPPQISIQHRFNDQGYCEIYFSDNGIGFDEKYANKIFEPFQRLSPNKDIDGTGMGMFICRKIVERHHGTIDVKSIPNEGTTFIVSLPEVQPV